MSEVIVVGKPNQIRSAIFAVFLAIMALFYSAMPIYADYFSGLIASGYASIGSNETTSHLIIGSSITSNSSLSIGESWAYIATSPSIDGIAASSITITSARLNSQVTNDGDDNCTVRFGLDTVSRSTFTDYSRISSWEGIYREGAKPYFDVTGLSSGTTYYYSVQIDNSYGTSTSTNEISFTTLSTIGNALGLVGNPSKTSIILTWKKASGSTHTIIRYRTDYYPSSVTDGLSAYDGTSFQCTITGLTPGQVYYFSAWGYANPTSSTVGHLAMSTTGESIPSGGTSIPTSSFPSLPTLPTTINQAPDTSGFNLEPFTSIIGYFTVNGLGMPVGNAWETLIIFGIVLAGLGTYVKTRQFFVAFAVVFLLSGAGWGLHLVQGYLVLFELIIGAGVWAIERAQQ
jgi:hypothetical protein